MRFVALLLLAANAPPTPAPLPDATPTLRGAVSTDPSQRLSGKVFVDRVLVNADAGAALVSTCVPRAADLRACPSGNGLQCVAGAGWFACQPDAGWAQISSGGGGGATYSGQAPISVSGSVISCDPAAVGQQGCLTAGNQQIGGKKGFPAGLETSFVDAGNQNTAGYNVAFRFVSTDTAAGSAVDGGGNFICRNNVAQSSPCLTNPIGPLEVGGSLQDGDPNSSAASIYLGVLGSKETGPVLTVLNNYGQGGLEVNLCTVEANGDLLSGGSLHLNTLAGSDGRVISDNGPLYSIANGGPLYQWSKASGDVTQWFSGPGGTQVGSLSSAGKLWTPSVITGSVDAGLLLQDGVPVETALTFTPPLSRATNTISCTMAALNTPGCIAGTAGQVQYFSGIKVFDEEPSFSASASYDTGLTASADFYHGVATGGPVFPNANGLALTLEGRRTDDVANVVVRASHWYDGGVIFAVQNSRPCQNSTPLLAITDYAIGFGGALAGPTCDSPSDGFAGALVHNAGHAGSFAMYRGAQDSLTLGGNLQGLNYALLEDGGHPNPADYSTGAVHTLDDGGTAFEWAGFHGAIQLATKGYQARGLLVTFDNSNHPVYDHRAFIDFNGGYGQSNQLSKSQWPTGNPLNVVTTLGQFYPNVLESTMYYDFDSSTDDGHKWYWKHSFVDGGSEYTQFAHQAPVFAPPIFVNGALVAGATLGGFVPPGSELVQIDALHIYVGTAGSGGSSNATIRFATGGNQCDFSFPCNSVAGAYRLAGSGNGCAPARNATYDVTVASLGACTGGGAPILTGNVTPEVRWR